MFRVKKVCVKGKSDSAPPQLFFFWAWAGGAEGGAFTHPEQGSRSPFVDRRASLSSPYLSPTPRHLISEPNFSLFGQGMPPRFRVGECPSPRLALLQHLGRGPGARAVRAGSIGWDMGWRVEWIDHPPERAGRFFPPLPEEISALWCQAKRPSPRALANAD